MAPKILREVINDDDIGETEGKKVDPASYSWEDYKENIQPIRQGRKFGDLMQALPLITSNKTRHQILTARKKQFDNDLEASSEDNSKQLDLWHEYIDWLEQNVPDGGKVNGITNSIELCIESFYDKKEFKQDKRLFNIFMKFKRFCDEPMEIFGFMYANSICTLLAELYLNWSWQYEIRKNVKRAEDLIKLGLKNLASPRDVLEEAQSQLKFRINRMIRNGELDDHCPEIRPLNTREMQAELASAGIRAALQTLKYSLTKKKVAKVAVNRIGNAVDQTNIGGLRNQVRIVNGVRVPKKIKAKKCSNIKVEIFADQQNGNVEAEEEEAAVTGTTTSVAVVDGETGRGPLSDMMIKVPTSQKIHMVGRAGAENHIPVSGRLAEGS